jgi:hypothetical protein
MIELMRHRRKDDMKISKANAQKAKDTARREKQTLMSTANKTLTSAQKRRMKELNEIIAAADKIIEGK